MTSVIQLERLQLIQEAGLVSLRLVSQIHELEEGAVNPPPVPSRVVLEMPLTHPAW
jgi:hypothetical protein